MSISYEVFSRLSFEGRRHHERGVLFEPPTARGRELQELYGLSRFDGLFSRETQDETLGVLDLLDRVAPRSAAALAFPGCRRLLDIGPKSWRYLPALSAWSGAREITGVELDARRPFVNLSTPESVALGIASELMMSDHAPACLYQVGDVRDFSPETLFDRVTWLFPFVLPEPHLAWGLPRKTFAPAAVAAHVESLVEPGGRLVMANQGEWEWDAARPLFRVLNLSRVERVEGSLHPCPHPIFVTLWTREA